MRTTGFFLATAALLLAMPAAFAEGFHGFYLGAKPGYGNARGEGGGMHIAAGAEFRFAPDAAPAWELSDHMADSNGGALHNTNFTLGVNFYAQ